MCEDESPDCEESLIGGRNIPTRTAAPTRTIILSPLPPPVNLTMGLQHEQIGPASRSEELAKTAQKCMQKLSGKEFVKGTDNGSRHSYGSVNAKSPLSPIARKCGRCGSTTCQCSILYLSVQRSLDRDHHLCGADASRQAQLAKTTQKCTQKFSGKEIPKGIDNGSRHSCGSVNAKPSLSPITCKCGRCGSITCQCNSCDSTHTSSNDLSVQRSLDRDHHLYGVDTSR